MSYRPKEDILGQFTGGNVSKYAYNGLQIELIGLLTQL